MTELKYIIFAVALWNAVSFVIYGIDKSNAIRNKRRISEKALLTCAFFMGGIGALFGMCIFRHKTKRLKFKICVPLAVVANILIFAYFCNAD